MTIVAIEHKYKLVNAETVDGVAKALDQTKSYMSSLIIITNLVSIPIVMSYGYLVNKKWLSLPKLLLISNTFCIIFGFSIIVNTTENNIGEFTFSISLIMVEAMVSCGFLVCMTILYNEMEAESRGTICGLQLLIDQLGVVVLTLLNGIIQDSQGREGIFLGTQIAYSVNFGLLGIYWVMVLIFVIKYDN